MSDVVAAAIEHFRRERILAEADKAYRAAPDHLDELALWDRTLLDGLPKD